MIAGIVSGIVFLKIIICGVIWAIRRAKQPYSHGDRLVDQDYNQEPTSMANSITSLNEQHTWSDMPPPYSPKNGKMAAEVTGMGNPA